MRFSSELVRGGLLLRLEVEDVELEDEGRRRLRLRPRLGLGLAVALASAWTEAATSNKDVVSEMTCSAQDGLSLPGGVRGVASGGELLAPRAGEGSEKAPRRLHGRCTCGGSCSRPSRRSPSASHFPRDRPDATRSCAGDACRPQRPAPRSTGA